ncbi:Type 1 glutamine amidotransferase-like domain-containing protein, partial [Patescibacteria group bacterium]
GFDSVLRDYVEKGGVLVGVSAGSMVMSPKIDVGAVDDDMEGTLNEIGLTDLTAMGLSGFEFFPHLNKDVDELTKRLKVYSKIEDSVVYACQDGDGIVVNGDDIQFIGDVLKFENGEVTNMGA